MTIYAIIDKAKKTEIGTLTVDCFIGQIAAKSRQRALDQLPRGQTVMLKSSLRRWELTAFNAGVEKQLDHLIRTAGVDPGKVCTRSTTIGQSRALGSKALAADVISIWRSGEISDDELAASLRGLADLYPAIRLGPENGQTT